MRALRPRICALRHARTHARFTDRILVFTHASHRTRARTHTNTHTHLRNSRACTGGPDEPDYCYYGPNYPVFFNIFFWLSLALIAATWMTIYMNANMEIKDSIIFRMTAMPKFKGE